MNYKWTLPPPYTWYEESKVETSIVNTAPGFGELSARNTEKRQWSGACDTASKQFTPLGYFLYLIKESRPTT